MPTDNGDAIRRTNAKRTKPRKNGAAAGDGGSAARRKERRRAARRLREERDRRAALTFAASFVFLVAVLFLCLRKPRRGETDTERYLRAKALRDAALSGRASVGDWAPRKGRRENDKGEPGKMRYLDPRQLPPLPGQPAEPYFGKGPKHGYPGEGDDAWVADAESSHSARRHGPKVDYTKHKYVYPDLMYEPPNDGTYPPLEKMSTIFETWGQDDLDSPPDTLVEVLQHFDYQDPEQMEVRSRSKCSISHARKIHLNFLRHPS